MLVKLTLAVLLAAGIHGGYNPDRVWRISPIEKPHHVRPYVPPVIHHR